LRTLVGPLIDAAAHERVQQYRSVAHVEGEVLIERDDVPDGAGTSGRRSWVTSNPRASYSTEEIFGPVLTMIRARDFDHALALANDTTTR